MLLSLDNNFACRSQCIYLLVVYALTDRICLSVSFGGVYLGCYHPQLLSYRGLNINGKKDYKFVGSSIPRSFLKDPDRSDYHPEDLLVPCRKCIGCKLDYSRQWADRLMLELDHSKTALFLTLTYDNDHITLVDGFLDEFGQPLFGTLVKRDLQLFNKRLRYEFPDLVEPDPDCSGSTISLIRYFAVGEYGTTTLRPHYHGIYFGLSLDNFPDAKLRKLNNSGQPLYHSDYLDSIWKNGDVTIGQVSWQACAYVARYSLKKQGPSGDLVACSRNCIPEFSLMSRRPGIGMRFLDDHPEFFDHPKDKLYLSDPYGIKHVNSVNPPKVFLNKLKLVNEPLYDIIKQERQKAADDRYFSELLNTDLDEYEYLNLKERLHENGSKALVRPL